MPRLQIISVWTNLFSGIDTPTKFFLKKKTKNKMVQTRSGEVSTASDSRPVRKPAAEKGSKNQVKAKTVNETAQKNEPIEARDDPAKRKRDENEAQPHLAAS